MSNQQIEQQNIPTNQNVFPQMENFNMNTHNLDLDIIQQKQMIDNLPLEDLMKNIQIYLKENNLSQLALILKLSQGKIPKNILSTYISENLGNTDVPGNCYIPPVPGYTYPPQEIRGGGVTNFPRGRKGISWGRGRNFLIISI